MGRRTCRSLIQSKMEGKIGIKINIETVEKPVSKRLMENVQMQGFRNWGPARRVGSQSEARTNPEE